MSETEPQQRLVSTGPYLQVMAKKMGLYSYGGLARALGILGVLWAGWGVLASLIEALYGRSWFFHLGMGIPLLVGSLSVSLLRHSNALFVKAKAIEPITDRNAHLLPLQETLVRSSAEPSIVQSAVLLRATIAGQETAAEQLLRSSLEE